MKNVEPQKVTSNKFWLLTLALAGFKLLLHLLVYNNYELHRDELLYFAQGQHLDWGYASTPPLIGFLTFILRHTFGYSVFGLKLIPALVGAADVVVIALFVRELGGKSFAVIVACAAFILSPAFLRSNSFLQPVSFDEFFWLLTAYLFLRMTNTGNERFWLGIALVSSVAVLAKYSIAFFIIALLIALLLSRHRHLLFSKYILPAVVLGLILIGPNLIWQFRHNLPLIHHMGELQRTQLVNENPFVFVMGQLLMNLPGIFIWISGLTGLLLLKKERRFQFVAVSFIVALIILLLGRGKAYYALGAYPMLFAAGGYILEKYFTGKLQWLSIVFISFGVLVSLLIMPLSLPILRQQQLAQYCSVASSFLGNWPTRWEDGKTHRIPQDFADMTGWHELAQLTSEAYKSLPDSEKKNCSIFASDYGEAGAIDFYGKEYGLPQACSANDAYLFWAPDTIGSGPFILIGDADFDMGLYFDSSYNAGAVNDEYFRENGVRVRVFSNPKPTWQMYYRERICKAKRVYNLCKN
jgi:hypothetical protein